MHGSGGDAQQVRNCVKTRIAAFHAGQDQRGSNLVRVTAPMLGQDEPNMATCAKTTWVSPKRRKVGDVMATPILCLVSLASLTLVTTPFLFLFSLMQPSTLANPGLSAYNPPPGTRVEAFARRVESSDQPREFSSATNFAREYARPELAEDAQPQNIQASTKLEARLTGPKKSHVGYRRKYEQSAHAYAQERNDPWETSQR